MFDYAAEIAAQNQPAPPSGFHSHQCTNCLCVWTHSDDNKGNAMAHRCPQCRKTVNFARVTEGYYGANLFATERVQS